MNLKLPRLARRKSPQVLVWVLYDDGHEAMIGPMDRFAAEAFLAVKLAQMPYYSGHLVRKARIIV